MKMKALAPIGAAGKIKAGDEFEVASKKTGDHYEKIGVAVYVKAGTGGQGAGSGSGAGGGTGTGTGDGDKTQKPTKKPAAELIAAIGECKTIDEVKEFFKGEDRPTVKDAAKAKIKELAKALKDAGK